MEDGSLNNRVVPNDVTLAIKKGGTITSIGTAEGIIKAVIATTRANILHVVVACFVPITMTSNAGEAGVIEQAFVKKAIVNES